MKVAKHKRFLIVFFIAFFCNDFVTQRKVESMAVAALPAAQQVVLSAQAAFALVSAAVYVAKVQIEKWYCEPPVPRQNFLPPQENSSSNFHASTPVQNPVTFKNVPKSEQAPETYTFKHFAIDDLVAQAMEQQLGASLSPEQKKAVQAVVANPFKVGMPPIAQVELDTTVFSDAQIARILAGPGFVRAECNLGNHRVYAQIGFKNSLPDRRATEQDLLEHRLQYRYDHDPDFSAYIDRECKEEMRTLINAVAKSATLGKISALKTFFATRVPAQFNRGLYQIRYWLAPLFFNHSTGELSTEPISTVQALRPIVEYFRQEYGDAWREELHNYLDVNEFATLLDAADEQGWYKKVNALYRAFYSAYDFLWTRLTGKVIANATNQKIMAVIETCQMQNFQAAKAIAQDANSKAADEIFAYFYNQKFDEYGIRRELANDPAWASLPESVKQEIKNVPDGISFFNHYLSVRAEERQKIAEEQKNRPCGSGLIKETEVPVRPSVVGIEEFKQKGVCIQGEQEIPVPKPCYVTKEQEPKTGCNYGTQIQPSFKDPEVVTQEDVAVDAEQQNEIQETLQDGTVKVGLPDEIIGLLPSKEEIEALKEKIVIKLPEEYGGHEIEIDLEHILGIDYDPEKDIVSGLHHDPNEALAKTGIITIEKISQIKTPDGFYAGWITYKNGKRKFSTFFPSEWSRIKVLEEIVKAWKDVVDNNKKFKLNDRRNYVVEGTVLPNKKIIFVLDHDLKRIITAYPDVLGK